MEKNNALAKLFATLGLLTIVCGFADTHALASTSVRFKQVKNLIVASVTLNGAGPFDFEIDTGSTATVIDRDLARQLSLSLVDSSLMRTVTGLTTLPRYRLDSLVLGSQSARNLIVPCAELREIHEVNSKIRGVLGQDFLSGFNYILDYRAQCIEFEEEGEFANTLQGTRLPVERDGGRVLLITQPSSPQKQASKLVLDSGTSSVVVFKNISRTADLEIEFDLSSGFNASTVTGTETISTGRLRKLQIGTEKFSWLTVMVVDNRAAVEGRRENGLLPTSLFRSIYFNNTQNFVILNPRLSEQS
ncbi:MAG TPA: aspartyl protease family protein [Blastocatellia bacterium]|nr:aspartyl protease family protein [Blastocatellia bacterium]